MADNIPGKTRKTNRRLLIFYDALGIIAVWALILALHPSSPRPFSGNVLIYNLIAALVCFTGFRLIFGVYRMIWRTGNVGAFARETAALIPGVLSYLALSRIVSGLPFTTALAFSVTCAAIGIFGRIAYYYVYRLAKKDNPLSRALKKLITALTLVDFDSEADGGVMRVVLEPAEASHSPINEIQAVAEKFAIRGEITSVTQINKGYINRTYKIETLSETGHVHKYLLQRINTNVFPDVDALMSNFKLTTDHLLGRLKLPGSGKKGSVQTSRPTKDGRAYLSDQSGCWRTLVYFDGVYSLDIPDSPETFYYAGKAFGSFIREMSDVDVSDVAVVIPNFHNTASRYRDLEKVIEKDPKGRLAAVMPEVEFIRARSGSFGVITEALESGRIPTRVCHNDCNLNNILFDKETHLPVAIIDLDTVMPSSPLYDYGDSMRIGTNTATDDEKDLSKVSCDLNLYAKYARGYLEECGHMLTKEELELLPLASLIITSEDGIRFLMAHIDGDPYYNIYYPGQNLDRSRTQLALLADMERKLPDIIAILRDIYTGLGLDAELDEDKITSMWRVRKS